MRKTLERMRCELNEFFRGVGCKNCRNTGFKGRMGVHELLVISDEMRDAIVANPTINHLRNIALGDGMITLACDGFRKVGEGITTVEEVFSIIGDSVAGTVASTSSPNT